MQGCETIFGAMMRLVAVGTPVTRRPPHRSGRALLMHPAPTSGVWREEADVWIWVQDSGLREPVVSNSRETFPRHSVPLASSPQGVDPGTCNLLRIPRIVATHSMGKWPVSHGGDKGRRNEATQAW